MFLATFLIMLREGLEAALIVGIIASYLKQTGNAQWIKYVWLGVFSAIAICSVLAYFIYTEVGELPQEQQELFEGGVAVLAVIILTYMVFWMRKASRTLKSELSAKIDTVIDQGTGQALLLVGMSFFAVAREAVESIFFLFSFFEQDSDITIPALGASLGLLSSVILGFIIYYGSIRLDLRKFFKYTSILLIFVAAGLAASALSSFHEAGVWNGLQEIVYDASRSFVSEHTILGSVLNAIFGFNDSPTVGEVLIYFIYLILALTFFFLPEKNNQKTN